MNSILHNRFEDLLTAPAEDVVDVSVSGRQLGLFHKPSGRLVFAGNITSAEIEAMLSEGVLELYLPQTLIALAPLSVQAQDRLGLTEEKENICLMVDRDGFKAHCLDSLIVGSDDPRGLPELIVSFAREAWGTTLADSETQELLGSSKRTFYSGTLDGITAGMCAATRTYGEYRCLSYVYVAPAYRDRGIAKALISSVAEAQLTDFSGLFLYVDSGNLAARQAYERCGFVSIGSEYSYRFR
jgi:ribosomal protein S18 acetylase RimI-like enzyme